jgi:hypothetical protein
MLNKAVVRISLSVPASAGFSFEWDKETWDSLSDEEKKDRLTAAIRHSEMQVSGDDDEFTGVSVRDAAAYRINEVEVYEANGDISDIEDFGNWEIKR